MPSFMSAKRAKIIGVAAAGALAVAGAVGATSLSSGTVAASVSTADTYVTVAGGH